MPAERIIGLGGYYAQPNSSSAFFFLLPMQPAPANRAASDFPPWFCDPMPEPSVGDHRACFRTRCLSVPRFSLQHVAVAGCPGVLAFVSARPHIRSMADGDPGTRGASVQRLVRGIFLRFGSLPKTKRKFLRSRFALWTAPPQSRAWDSHRQRLCGRATKEKTP